MSINRFATQITVIVMDNFLGVFAKLRKVPISFVMSVCLSLSRLSVCPSAWNTSPPTGRIFVNFDI